MREAAARRFAKPEEMRKQRERAKLGGAVSAAKTEAERARLKAEFRVKNGTAKWLKGEHALVLALRRLQKQEQTWIVRQEVRRVETKLILLRTFVPQRERKPEERSEPWELPPDNRKDFSYLLHPPSMSGSIIGKGACLCWFDSEGVWHDGPPPPEGEREERK